MASTMTKKKNTSRPYKTGLILPDLHVPIHDPWTLVPILEYATTQWWDYCVQLGDFMDFNCISSFNDNTPRRKMGETLRHDYACGNEVLDDIIVAVRAKNPACEVVILEGNHDERIERYIDKNPELEGIMEPPLMLDFERRGVRWVRSWSRGEVYSIGKADFVHGLYHNIHHAKKTALAFGGPVFYAHVHDIQAYSEVLRGDNKTIMAQSMGCLCTLDQPYMRGKPNRWQQAFGVFHFYDDGYFQPMTIPIFKHRFVGIGDGKVYDGR